MRYIIKTAVHVILETHMNARCATALPRTIVLRAVAAAAGHRGHIGGKPANAIDWAKSRIQSSVGKSVQTQDDENPASSTFSELLAEHALSKLSLQKTTTAGQGVISQADIESPGTVIVRVPLDKCLVVDYSSGMRVPPGQWPRLTKGVEKDASSPWDVLVSLALLDGLAGAGDAFWSRYTNDMLPEPLSMTIPFCLPERLLEKVDHPEVRNAAQLQKTRLRELFPGMAKPACVDGPTWMEWAFANCRSRAFALGADFFAFVPFLDAVNHAAEPNADFRLSPDDNYVELVSLASISEEEEVTISYTGKDGYSSQRLFQQYGFTPRGGNFADRYVLKCMSESDASANGLLSLEAIQAALGDGEEMVAAFSGRNPFMYAALRSLPISASETQASPLAEQIELAKTILNEIEAERISWATRLEEDEVELVRLEDEARAGAGDPRLEAVLRYNVQRKLMVSSMERVLQLFCQ